MGGGSVFAQVTFTSLAGRIVRLVVGILLILLGLIQVGVVSFSFHRVADLAQPILKAQAGIRRENPFLGFAIFGFGYLIAGFG